MSHHVESRFTTVGVEPVYGLSQCILYCLECVLYVITIAALPAEPPPMDTLGLSIWPFPSAETHLTLNGRHGRCLKTRTCILSCAKYQGIQERVSLIVKTILPVMGNPRNPNAAPSIPQVGLYNASSCLGRAIVGRCSWHSQPRSAVSRIFLVQHSSTCVQVLLAMVLESGSLVGWGRPNAFH